MLSDGDGLESSYKLMKYPASVKQLSQIVPKNKSQRESERARESQREPVLDNIDKKKIS